MGQKVMFSFLAFIFSFSAGAMEVGRCGGLDSIGFLAFNDRNAGIKTYYSGNVLVAHVDTYGEPACCSSHLLIFVPDEEGMSLNCFAVSASVVNKTANLGVMNIEFDKITSQYNAATGLDLTVPYLTYNETGTGDKAVTKVRINLNLPQDEKVKVIR